MPSEIRIRHLTRQFNDLFGNSDNHPRLFFAPGRVNLIGEHTDYNGGYVLPCALQFGTLLLCRYNDMGTLRLASMNFSYRCEIPVTSIREKTGQEWVNYPVGVIAFMADHIEQLRGMDLLFEGDIPNGAGLSSSASIEMVTALAVNHLYGLNWPMIELVKVSRKAENEFVGVNCGIMDQFAVGFGKASHALFLNCDTLEYQHVPFDLKDYGLVITNTNKKRTLSDSKYNERVRECNEALRQINRFVPVHHLSQLNEAVYETYAREIADEMIRKRARHVITENRRVADAMEAMRLNDLQGLGRLMNESHESLRSDYEVTGIELDTLVEVSRKIPGVLGSRMTGAGFGGCTVSIVHQDSLEHFQQEVPDQYQSETGIAPSMYIAEISDGARQISL